MLVNLNNLDIIILFVVGISGLIAYSRGLVKEVLSIIGWVGATIAVVYFLPMINPFVAAHVVSGTMSGVASALFIAITFLVIWALFTGKIVDKIRISKLNSLDRTLGLIFGVARAVLLVILMYILVSWMMPVENRSHTLTESKYFNLAGQFAKPLEDLIPEDTLESIKAMAVGLEEDIEGDEDKDALFEKLSKPKAPTNEKPKEKEVKKPERPVKHEGYKDEERQKLENLLDSLLDELLQ
jgi:membrane protein required for colicin V production